MAGKALVVEDMLAEVVLEAGHSVEHQRGGVEADGAVRAVNDVPGCGLDLVQGLHLGVSVQHLLQKGGQLTQADPAGRAFPAGLGVA